MAYFYPAEKITFTPHPKFEGVKIAVLVNSTQSPQASVSVLEISPAVTIPVHTHDPQIDSILVVEGEGEAYINGNWQKIKAGDYIFIPPREEHGVKNTSQRVLRLFVVHSPPLF